MFYNDKIKIHLSIVKNEELLSALLTVVKLVYDICMPFQWRPLWWMRIQKHAVPSSNFQLKNPWFNLDFKTSFGVIKIKIRAGWS
jgi:hypothetical protein